MQDLEFQRVRFSSIIIVGFLQVRGLDGGKDEGRMTLEVPGFRCSAMQKARWNCFGRSRSHAIYGL